MRHHAPAHKMGDSPFEPLLRYRFASGSGKLRTYMFSIKAKECRLKQKKKEEQGSK